MFPTRDGWDGMGVPEHGWEMSYKATVRIPGRYTYDEPAVEISPNCGKRTLRKSA
ncbi:hypothetical protein ACFQY7_43435 [Actinomadura luteofluorescens]